jgi:hypothetical protein
MTSNLRTQFHNFMTIERFSDHTKRLYLRSAIGLARFYNRSPDKSHKTILLKQPPSVPIHCQKKSQHNPWQSYPLPASKLCNPPALPSN